MSTSLTTQFNSLMLHSVPTDVSGKPTRRAAIYDLLYAQDAQFLSALEGGRTLSHSRTLADTELESIRKSIEEKRPFQAPAGIPGFDRIAVRGGTFVNLCGASGRLSTVVFMWHPPVVQHNGEGDTTILTDGYWTQDITVSLVTRGIPQRAYLALKQHYFPPKATLEAAH